jgi:uncharacterized protein YwqG
MEKLIPAFKLIPEPLTEEAKNLPKFKWADAIVGTRHKLGGVPDFIQNKEYPKCPDCGETMTFYAQLDSLNDDFCIADVGMIYIFICFECLETKSIIQSH